MLADTPLRLNTEVSFCIDRYVDNCLSRISSEESYHSGSQQNFITRQLLILVGVMDLSDEVGRYIYSKVKISNKAMIHEGKLQF